MPEGEDRPKDDYPQLLSLAAHELRSPASVIGGYLRMLQQDTSPLSPRQLKMVTEAERSCAHMVELIAELSELAKLDAGTAAVDTRSFDLFTVLREVVKTVPGAPGVPGVETREIRLEVAGESSGAAITGDLFRLEHAFRTFCRAVVREQPKSCVVTVDCRRVLDDVRTAVVTVAESSVIHQAIGASRSPLNHIRGGLGLALPIAARVVERHGGSVWSPQIPHPAIAAALPIEN
jgi:signal transduction histidine kinase